MGRWTGIGIGLLALGIATLAAFEAPSGPPDQNNPLYLVAWVALVVGFVCLVWGLASKEGGRDTPPPAVEHRVESPSQDRVESPSQDRVESPSQEGSENVQVTAGHDAVVGNDNIVVSGDIYLTEPVSPRDDRIVVKASPQDITDLYKGRMTIEGDRLFERFKDHWMRVEGTVENVADHTTWTSVKIGSLDKPPVLWLTFRDEGERKRALVHQRGESMRVLGRISGASSVNVELDNCEVID